MGGGRRGWRGGGRGPRWAIFLFFGVWGLGFLVYDKAATLYCFEYDKAAVLCF